MQHLRFQSNQCSFIPLLLHRIAFLITLALSFLIQIQCTSAIDQSNLQILDPPNIIIILADDLGYGDLGCYNPGSHIATPNLDQLASEGMRFTNAYCPSAVCSPTRYALMTGNYPWRSWNKTGVMRNYEPSMMADTLLTLPMMLQKEGYHTAGFGKWHLGTTFATTDGEKPIGFGQFYAEENGANLDLTAPLNDGPLDHGFDQWLGFSCASECWVFENRKVFGAIQHEKYNYTAAKGLDEIEEIPLEKYLSFITQKTIKYLENQSTEPQPFFLYFAPYVPHVPLAVEAPFQGKSTAGRYGDYVQELDHYVGQILKTLNELALTENTLIVFASDNGSQYVKINQATDLDTAYSPKKEIISFDQRDFHYPNRPFRGNKWTVYDGGVRTPLIIKWPGGQIASGSTTDQLCLLNDIMPTLGDIIDAEQKNNLASDSYSLKPAITGGSEDVRKTVILQSAGRRMAVRNKGWKYICTVDFEKMQFSSTDAELYNLQTDPSERINLIQHEQERAESLRNELEDLVFGSHK